MLEAVEAVSNEQDSQSALGFRHINQRKVALVTL